MKTKTLKMEIRQIVVIEANQSVRIEKTDIRILPEAPEFGDYGWVFPE